MLALAQSLAHVRGIHLVAATIPEGGRGLRRLPERSIEGGGVLRRVREDRRCGQRFANRADAAVHHVARRDHVGTGLDVTHGCADEQVERRVVVDLLAVEHPAVSVRGVLAETDVRDEDEVATVQLAQRTLHDAVLVPGARAFLVLLVGNAEEDDGLYAQADELVRFGGHALDGMAGESGQLLVRELDGPDEQRHDEIREVEARLANEVAQPAGAPQAAEPRHRKRAHGYSLDTADGVDDREGVDDLTGLPEHFVDGPGDPEALDTVVVERHGATGLQHPSGEPDVRAHLLVGVKPVEEDEVERRRRKERQDILEAGDDRDDPFGKPVPVETLYEAGEGGSVARVLVTSVPVDGHQLCRGLPHADGRATEPRTQLEHDPIPRKLGERAAFCLRDRRVHICGKHERPPHPQEPQPSPRSPSHSSRPCH